ncbi:tRNA pseudouridine(55) synthase TruB [Paenibacillus oenotherae]|uniref:tRNA pseudouridine synthase B n=1 Tax=Paenibacillus oenotherae TaxID=1435645 RepID=A0ABS7D098_9BACL|nr:tRNA pseudouridine(55) synthase TruB [Paenibacillus oenotherae]MBW7473251.1 tRNA pseudouridine(55) synthase TruB [Paenibacillus oenotherae]
MDGILAVWKPAGWTSHDVVAKVRRLIRVKRIGHTGTLDPEVTGVLPLCIGRSTRMVEYLQERPKAYEAVLQLGQATDTEDLTGNVIAEVAQVVISEPEIKRVLASFIGIIEQVPPMYSAVKVDGKRLYELAREGQVIERKSRQVTIHKLELQQMELNVPHPRISFSVTCSKGTYIRTLCVDIGRALGVPAAMAKLTRTMSAGFTAENCLTLEEIEELQASGELASRLMPPDAALDYLPSGKVNAETARHAFQGKRISLDLVQGLQPSRQDELVRLYGEDGLFLGLFEVEDNSDSLKPVKVFTPV